MPEYTKYENIVPYVGLNFQVNMTNGFFLIQSRYPSNDKGHTIYAKLSLQFLRMFPEKSEGLETVLKIIQNNGGTYMNSRDVSDLCVKIFDTRGFKQFFNENATFAFETSDGQIIEQHST